MVSIHLPGIAHTASYFLRWWLKCRRHNSYYALKRRSSLHATDNFTLRLSLPSALAQAVDAAQVAHNITSLAKVYLLQEIAHLELHVLHQTADIGNMALVGIDRQVLLYLARHVSAEVELAEAAARSGTRRSQRQDNSRGEFVMCRTAALNRFEYVNRVPDTVGRSAGWCSYEVRLACSV